MASEPPRVRWTLPDRLRVDLGRFGRLNGGASRGRQRAGPEPEPSPSRARAGPEPPPEPEPDTAVARGGRGSAARGRKPAKEVAVGLY